MPLAYELWLPSQTQRYRSLISELWGGGRGSWVSDQPELGDFVSNTKAKWSKNTPDSEDEEQERRKPGKVT